jgi:hypothetical protein
MVRCQNRAAEGVAECVCMRNSQGGTQSLRSAGLDRRRLSSGSGAQVGTPTPRSLAHFADYKACADGMLCRETKGPRPKNLVLMVRTLTSTHGPDSHVGTTHLWGCRVSTATLAGLRECSDEVMRPASARRLRLAIPPHLSPCGNARVIVPTRCDQESGEVIW